MTIDARQANRIKPDEIPLLWRRRLPLGTLSLVAGRPGSGKSQIALLMAAELSQQGLATLISNPEDDLETVARPRLEAYRCKDELVYFADSLFSLPKHLADLENLIRAIGASLVVLDPIAGHFEPEGWVHNRLALRKLIDVARRTRCAILGVHHTVKGHGMDLIQRIGGSMGGLVGSSRAVYMFDRDMSRVEDRGKAALPRWALKCVKINGLEEPGQLIFERHAVQTRSGLEAPWLRLVDRTYGANPDIVAQASEWLTTFLAAGQDCVRLNGEVRTECQDAGFSWQMMQTLAMDLGFLTKNGKPSWQLPNHHPLRSSEVSA